MPRIYFEQGIEYHNSRFRVAIVVKCGTLIKQQPAKNIFPAPMVYIFHHYQLNQVIAHHNMTRKIIGFQQCVCISYSAIQVFLQAQARQPFLITLVVPDNPVWIPEVYGFEVAVQLQKMCGRGVHIVDV